MSNARRAPLPRGRRIPIYVALDPDTHRELKKLQNGNRSAAIEWLVAEYLGRKRILEPA